MIVRPLYRQTAPKNRGSVKPAQSAISALTPQIQEQLSNALLVNGYPSILWRKKFGGLRCTCKGGSAPQGSANPLVQGTADGSPIEPTFNSLEPGITALSTEPHTVADRWNANNTGQIEILPYGVRTQRIVSPGDASRPNQAGQAYQQPNPELSKHAQGSAPGAVYTDNIRKETSMEFENADLIEDRIFDPNGAIGDLEVSAMIDALTDSTLNGSGCGVCLGDGWVGGYDPLNGFRIVLAAGVSDTVENQGIAADVPFTFNPGVVSWNVIIPHGASLLMCAKTWNNKTRVNGEITLTDTTTGIVYRPWNNFPRCRPLLLTVTTQDVFTHVELMWNVEAGPFLVDFGSLSETQNLALALNYDPVTVNCSPVPMVRVGDVITENVYNFFWQVTSVKHSNSKERRPLGWELSIRLLQTYELPALLPLTRRGAIAATSLPRIPNR